MNKTKQNFTCRICGNSSHNNSFVVREMMLGTKDEFLYFECSACRCVQISSIPTNIARYYSSGYYSLTPKKTGKLKVLTTPIERLRIQSGVGSLPVVARQFVNKLLPARNVSFLKGFVNNTEVRILDVGCGNGQKFLFPLYRSGFKRVAGCDPYILKEMNQEGEPPIYKKELSGMKGEWDILTFNHSFEHLHNPLEGLQQANRLLKKGGICIIRIPTVSSYAWQHYGTNWFQLDAPRHFFIHSVESIRYLSEETGFNIINIKYDSTHHQFTLSERYKMGKTLKERNYNNLAGRINNAFRKMGYASKAARLNKQNRGDQAVFYLKKE